jgi:hypothetical protein
MSDGSGSMSVRGHRPGARGDRSTNRLLERIVRMMAEMEDGRRPATSLDLAATPLAARRIQSVVLTARNERHRRPSGGGNRTTPVLVRTSTSFHPSAGVTEGVVLVRRDRRTRAYCVRLEQQGAHWRIVELGGRTVRQAAPWQRLYFCPLPQGQGSLRPTRSLAT